VWQPLQTVEAGQVQLANDSQTESKKYMGGSGLLAGGNGR